MGWAEPVYAHIPLIHGPDGAKLSKRHGALGVDAYRDMGFLPAALRNYLLRLGWGHGDDEIISTEQAIEWFDLANVGRAPSRFDVTKLTNLNAHYLREMPDDELAAAGAAPGRGQDRQRHRHPRHGARQARPVGRQATLAYPGRAGRQSGFLRAGRRTAAGRR